MSTPPEAIGDFRVLDSLGRGDFAVVYRVGKGDSEYALKLAHADSTEARVRLRIEAEALKALDHPSIPKFEMAGVFENRPYVVMKLAKGRSLRQDLQEKQTRGAVYGDIEALDFLVHLLDALSHLHGAGLVHRDIKDANIMVASEPISLTLIDFGFSKIINRDDIRLGDSFFRAGAIRYSPPLKIQRPEVAVPNHDVFAAGVIAYQMLTGTHPWSVNADQGLGAYRDAQRRPPIPLTEINPRVDRSISQFVMSLLEHDDARRPQANEARSQGCNPPSAQLRH